MGWPPPPPLNGPAIKRIIFFAASLGGNFLLLVNPSLTKIVF